MWWRWAGWSAGIALLIVVGRAASMMARYLAHPEEVKPGETP